MISLKKMVKKKFDFGMRTIAIKGMNNIQSELSKEGQEAKVTYTIDKNKVTFVVEPKQEKIESEDIPADQARTVLKGFEKIPIELLNQEMSKQEFSTAGINRAMERTQEQAGKQIQDAIKKLI
jgi:hypothetical protein